MTATQATAEPCFAWIEERGGPAVTWADSGRHALSGDGLVGWWAFGSGAQREHESIRKSIEDEARPRSIEIYPIRNPSDQDGSVRWESSLNVGGDRRARAHGTARSFPEAVAIAEAYRHEIREMGGLTWWLESEDRWVSWLGPFNLEATKITPSLGGDSYWHYQVSGNAQTLEEAALLASLGRVPAAGGLDTCG